MPGAEVKLTKMDISLKNELVPALDLQPGEVDSDSVTHIDAARNQIIGSSAGLIPFIEKNYVLSQFNGLQPATTGCTPNSTQAPIVGTGLEGDAARNTGQVVLAEDSGEVTAASWSEVIVKYKDGNSVSYEPQRFIRSNEGTSINQKVVVNSGDKVKKGDVLIEGMSIENGELALGKDL